MRIWAVAALSIVAFFGQTHRPKTREAASSVAVIPFREVAGHIYVEATISGLKDLSVLIDTGSPGTIVSQALYKQLKLPFVGLANLGPAPGGLGQFDVLKTSVPSVSFAGVTMKNVPALVLPLPHSTGADIEVAAIIGPALFSRYVVALDFADKVLRLYDPVHYIEPQGGCKVPLSLRTYPLIHAGIIAGDGKVVDAVLSLDSGSEYPLLTKSFTTLHPDLELKHSTIAFGVAQTVQGASKARAARVLGIRLGTCTIEDPVVLFPAEATGLWADDHSVSGNIGLSIFRQFTTIFDYPKGFVVFESPKKASGRPN